LELGHEQFISTTATAQVRSRRTERIVTTADKLLSRCTIVRQLRPRKNIAASWRCTCPGHEDSKPSLDVDETADGRVLLVCRAGCSVHDIVAGAGLELSDLFPPRPTTYSDATRPRREQFNAADAMRLIDNEVNHAALLILVCALHDLTPERRNRLAQAAHRIRRARQACGLRGIE